MNLTFDQHWAMLEPQFRQWIETIRANPAKAEAASEAASFIGSAQPPALNVEDGIAVIDIAGPVLKSPTLARWYGGTSTRTSRQLVTEATNDRGVRAIMLRIDSPGGTVSGTSDMADAVRAASAVKPTWAYIEDMGASAAYWIASQAGRIVTNQTALVGSIGTYMVVWDWSQLFASEGIKAHVVRAGAFKGAGAQGTEITPEQLAAFQREIDALNAHFLDGVSRGRGMDINVVKSLADGTVLVGADAVSAGLTDQVMDFHSAMVALSSKAAKKTSAGAYGHRNAITTGV